MSRNKRYTVALNGNQPIPKTSTVWLRMAHMSIILSSQKYEPNKYQPKSHNIQDAKGIKGVTANIGSFEGLNSGQVFFYQ